MSFKNFKFHFCALIHFDLRKSVVKGKSLNSMLYTSSTLRTVFTFEGGGEKQQMYVSRIELSWGEATLLSFYLSWS